MEQRTQTLAGGYSRNLAQLVLLLIIFYPWLTILEAAINPYEVGWTLPSGVGILNSNRTLLLSLSLLASGLYLQTTARPSLRGRIPWGLAFLGWALMSCLFNENRVDSLLFFQTFASAGLTYSLVKELAATKDEKIVLTILATLATMNSLNSLWPLWTTTESLRATGLFLLPGVLANWQVMLIPILFLAYLRPTGWSSAPYGIASSLSIVSLALSNSRAGWVLGGLGLCFLPLIAAKVSRKRVLVWCGLEFIALGGLYALKGSLEPSHFLTGMLTLLSVPTVIEILRKRNHLSLTSKLVALMLVSALLIVSTSRHQAGDVAPESLKTFHQLDTQNNSVKARASLMHSAIKMTLDHPVFGVGPSQFRTHYPTYQTTYVYYSDSPHGSSLELASETGILGLALLAGFFLRLFIRAASQANLTELQKGAISGIVLGLAYAQIEVSYQFAYLWISVAILAGLVNASDQKAEPSPPPSRILGLIFSVGAILLLTLVYPVVFKYENVRLYEEPEQKWRLLSEVSESWPSWQAPTVRAIGYGLSLKKPLPQLVKLAERLKTNTSVDASVYVHAGDVALLQGDKQRAHIFFQKAIQLDPFNSPSTYSKLLSSLGGRLDDEAHQKIWERVRKLYPVDELPKAHTLHREKMENEIIYLFINLANSLNPYERPKETEPFFRDILKIKFVPSAAFGLGVSLSQQNRHEEAKPLLLKAHQSNPMFPLNP